MTKTKVRFFAVVSAVFMLFSVSLTADAAHSHVYRLYNKTLMATEVINCVTSGCRVTRNYYEETYKCSCGDWFKKNTVEDSHSMIHN